MPKLHIDGKELTFRKGDSLLETAGDAGIKIPTLCHIKGLEGNGGCMVCSVRDISSGKILPACAARAEEGMQIDASSETVRDARRRALEMILLDHAGDCEAPCQMACPAQMHIPEMLRALSQNKTETSARIVYEHIALPRTLAKICSAPCERVCRRAGIDTPVAICRLKGDAVKDGSPSPVPPPSPNAKRIAIIGAGPTGLACAFYASRLGHHCTLFDSNPEPGGSLLSLATPNTLPADALKADLDLILAQGISLQLNCTVSDPDTLSGFDLTILACGAGDNGRALAKALELETSSKGIITDPHTHLTHSPGILAGGACTRPMRMAVQAVAHGREMALSANSLLQGNPPVPKHRLQARAGRLDPDEIRSLLEETSPGDPQGPLSATASEAGRCLHCDCRKADNCRLRDLAEVYEAHQPSHRDDIRRRVTHDTTHPEVIYESGKCIACGLCIGITKQEKEPIGLTFIGRGAGIHIAPPLGHTFAEAITHSAEKCTVTCPTGALSQRED